MISIRPVKSQEAELLTQIALHAKRHWGYPESWIVLWTPQLTFDAAYFETNESWAAELDGRPVAFYTLLDKDGRAWLENLWVMPEMLEILKEQGEKMLVNSAHHTTARYTVEQFAHLIPEMAPRGLATTGD